MNLTPLENDLRQLFGDYEKLLDVPERLPEYRPVEWSGPGRRAYRLVGAGLTAAAAVTVGAVVWINDPSTDTDSAERPLVSTAGPADETIDPADRADDEEPEFVFDTPMVAFSADRVAVDVGGRTFVPNETVEVNGDPGTRDEYTTLELTWFEDDIEMRINLYFAGSGGDWWVSEIRTYDGESPGEWITVEEQHFRRPLGSAFEGDVTVGPLTMEGLRLEGFRTPPACAATSDVAIQPFTDEIRFSGWADPSRPGNGPDAGYNFGALVYDTTTCEPVPPELVDVRFDVIDDSVMSAEGAERWRHDGANGVALNVVGEGATTLVVAVYSIETDELLDRIEIPITVE